MNAKQETEIQTVIENLDESDLMKMMVRAHAFAMMTNPGEAKKMTKVAYDDLSEHNHEVFAQFEEPELVYGAVILSNSQPKLLTDRATIQTRVLDLFIQLDITPKNKEEILDALMFLTVTRGLDVQINYPDLEFGDDEFESITNAALAVHELLSESRKEG